VTPCAILVARRHVQDHEQVGVVDQTELEHLNQQRLVEAWQRGTDDLMRYLPGFISANIHRSLDGTKVINYAQWASPRAFQATLTDPKVQAYFEELSQIGTPAPVLAEVVSVHRAASASA
jgi:quinol monooxygenase YgiN